MTTSNRPSCAKSDADALRREAALWVARIQEGEAGENDFAEWEEWLNADPRHAEAYEAAEEIWALAGQIKPVPWPTREELQIESAGSTEPIPGAHERPAAEGARAGRGRAGGGTRGDRWRRLRRGFGTRTLALAATLILGLAVALWWSISQGPTVLETAIAEQRSVRLADGSRVTLAGETRLIVRFREGRRDLDLKRGEAYFEVAHDPAHPFTVRVGNHEAVAVGTAFDVDANADQMTVTVTEGVVKLRPVLAESTEALQPETLATTTTPPVLELTAGERGETDGRGAHRLAATVTPERAVSWRDGRLEYLHESLSVVIHDVNRYTDRKIELADESVGNLHYTGTVFLDQLDAWLSGLPGTFPVEVVSRGSHRVLQHVSERSVEASALSQDSTRR